LAIAEPSSGLGADAIDLPRVATTQSLGERRNGEIASAARIRMHVVQFVHLQMRYVGCVHSQTQANSETTEGEIGVEFRAQVAAFGSVFALTLLVMIMWSADEGWLS